MVIPVLATPISGKLVKHPQYFEKKAAHTNGWNEVLQCASGYCLRDWNLFLDNKCLPEIQIS